MRRVGGAEAAAVGHGPGRGAHGRHDHGGAARSRGLVVRASDEQLGELPLRGQAQVARELRLRLDGFGALMALLVAGIGVAVFAYAWSYFSHPPRDLGRLAEITQPTLIIAAEADRLRGPDEAKELHRGIAGSTLVHIPDSGHMIPLEQPKALAKVMTEWLSQLPTS